MSLFLFPLFFSFLSFTFLPPFFFGGGGGGLDPRLHQRRYYDIRSEDCNLQRYVGTLITFLSSFGPKKCEIWKLDCIKVSQYQLQWKESGLVCNVARLKFSHTAIFFLSENHTETSWNLKNHPEILYKRRFYWKLHWNVPFVINFFPN